MSQTNDLIDYIIVSLESSSVFGTGTDFRLYSPSDWYKEQALEAPYVYIRPVSIRTDLNSSILERRITLEAQMFIKYLPTVTDDGNAETDLEALYYYIEKLNEELIGVSTDGHYYLEEIMVDEFPKRPVDRKDLLGGVIRLTFGGHYYFG